MANESLGPSLLVDAQDWTKKGGGAADVASIDDGVLTHDGDGTYIEQTASFPVEGFDFECHLSDPVGVPDMGSGIASWTVRVVARKVGDVGPASFLVGLYEGAVQRTEFDMREDLTGAFAQLTGLFDPALIVDPTDLRLRFTSQGTGGENVQVTAADLLIVVDDPPADGARDRSQTGIGINVGL